MSSKNSKKCALLIIIPAIVLITAAVIIAVIFIRKGKPNDGETAWYTSNGYALSGRDAVEYFGLSSTSDGIIGNAMYNSTYKDGLFLFKDQTNKDIFDNDPSAYIPQYGGYCAYAVSRSYTAPGDPNAWTVYGGKLYINNNKGVRSTWLRNTESNIDKANDVWKDWKYSN